MKTKEQLELTSQLNLVKFVAVVVVLTFGRKAARSGEKIMDRPYTWDEACETIDKVADRLNPENEYFQ